jgi:ornithine carbamoyltransferase
VYENLLKCDLQRGAGGSSSAAFSIAEKDMKHLLSIESISRDEILAILDLAHVMKTTRGHHERHPLRHQCWALMFSKSSTRTRVSFEVGIRELGGDVFFLAADDIQLGRGEPISDTARVMGRMCHGAVIRTFAQSDVEDFARYSGIPTVNALTDDEHPCQILADLQTIIEARHGYAGRVVTFIGDGACNVPISWMWAASKLDFELRIAAPKQYQPAPETVRRAFPSGNGGPGTHENPKGGRLVITDDIEGACRGADVLYSDVWVSMGKEEESEYRKAQLSRYQISEHVTQLAKPGALVMHCLPAYRGLEITESIFEAHADTIFTQAENRLHAQKAILAMIAAG